MKQPEKSWQPPPDEGRENASARMGWLQDVVAAGESFNASLSNSKDQIRAIDMISGRTGSRLGQLRSTLTMNRGKRALRETVANISDIRAIDGYSSDNPAYQDFLTMQNKVWKAVYFESKFPRAMKRCVQWLTSGGYAFISPVYRNLRLSARSAKRIDFDVFNKNDVLTFQMPEDFDIQRAYAHTLIRFMPNYEAHAKFPKFQSQLRPVARRRYSGNAAKDRIGLAERFRAGDSPQQGTWSEQMNELRYTHVNDLSINETKKPRPMGAPGALESYIVPFIGQELPTSEFIQPGIRKTRKATEEDCYLYPNLRLFISQSGMKQPMYDGPGFDWHGMFPLARFSADEWPWEPGYSLAGDIFSVEETRQQFERGIDQTAKARFDPALIYDKGIVPRKTAEQFDPYEERGRLGLDGAATENAVRTALPQELLNAPAWAFDWLKHLGDSEDYMLGNDAMNNLAKAKLSAASGDAVERAMEEAGPIVKDISHGMELPMQDIMEMCLGLVLQYYPPGRIMQYVGPDAVSREIFDLDPSSLVPSHVLGEDPENGPSIYTRMERTKIFMSNIHALITPGSLHGVVQTAQKLLYLQIARSGGMISSETVMKANDVPNWGTLDGNTELEKWKSEQEMKLEFAVKMKQLEGSLVPLGPAGPPVPQGTVNSGPQPGRPPSGQKAPHMVTKGSAEGPRAVISES